MWQPQRYPRLLGGSAVAGQRLTPAASLDGSTLAAGPGPGSARDQHAAEALRSLAAALKVSLALLLRTHKPAWCMDGCTHTLHVGVAWCTGAVPVMTQCEEHEAQCQAPHHPQVHSGCMPFMCLSAWR